MIIFDDIPDFQLRQWQWSPSLAMREKTVVFFDIPNVDAVYRLSQPLSSDMPQQKNVEKAIDIPEEEDFTYGQTVPAGAFSSYLRTGEKLLWAGQPDMNFRLTRKPELIGFMMLIISSPLIAIALWIPWRLAFNIQTNYFPLFFCGLFVGIFLLALIFERPFRKRLHYAVSNQRVLELVSMAGQTICRQTSVAGLRYMTKSVYDDTTGTLFFTPPAKGLLAMLFGPDASLMSLNGFNSISRQEPIFLCIQKPEVVERLIQELRQKKGLPDIKAGNDRHQPIQTFVHADLNPMTRKRQVSALLKARVLLFSQQAVAIWAVLIILPVFFCISVNMLLSCNWASILELIGFNNSAGLRTSVHGPEQFFGAPFHLIWALGVLSLLPVGLVFISAQLANRWQSIELLKYGERTIGQRLPNERVLLLVNGRPSLCERNYEFSVNGNTYQVKSVTAANQPRAKEVTVLFDRQNPDHALVLDDLPGIPIISTDDMIVGYSK